MNADRVRRERIPIELIAEHSENPSDGTENQLEQP
jgi:hypothetical protein